MASVSADPDAETRRLLVEARRAMEASEDAVTVDEVEAQHQAAAYAYSRLDRLLTAGAPIPLSWRTPTRVDLEGPGVTFDQGGIRMHHAEPITTRVNGVRALGEFRIALGLDEPARFLVDDVDLGCVDLYVNGERAARFGRLL